MTPKLRFPEFNDEWQSIKLGQLLEFKNGINASKEQYGSGIKFINVLDIIENNYITHDKIKGAVNINNDEIERNLVQYGDILFQRSSETREEVGQANVYLDTRPAVFGGFVIRGKKKSDYYPQFLNYLLRTAALREDITSRSGGSTRYNIGQESLVSVSAYMPVIAEQQKIADFLRAVDERIGGWEKKVELLKEYKKGVMQKIFSQEIRFKGDNGDAFPDWTGKYIGSVFAQRDERYEDGLKLLSVTQDNGVVDREEIDRKDSSSSDKSNYKRVYAGDIAYNSMRMWQGASGVSRFDGVVSPAYTVLMGNNQNSSEFFAYYFKLPKLIKAFERYSQGLTSDTWNLKYPQIAKIRIAVPTLEEQQRIAEFLTVLDEKIKLEEGELEQAKKFKQGLLQQMFV